MPTVALPYTNPFGNGLRPYLVLNLTGLTGTSGPIVGLLDSGADNTALPTGYAALMGYQAPQLERIEVGTAKGSGYAWQAKDPCRATLEGSSLTIDLHPTFVDCATPLWGRGDVMRMFTAVAIEDAAGQFTLSW